MVLDFKGGKKAINEEMKKQMFGKRKFSGSYRDNGGKQNGLLTDFAGFLPVYTPSSYYSYLWWSLPSQDRSSIYILLGS